MKSKWLFYFGAVARGVVEGRIPARDLRVLTAVFACERAALCGITFATIPRTRRWLRRMGGVATIVLGREPQHRVLWALDAGTRHAVGTCLTRALAAEALLPASMQPALIIGVASGGRASRLDAHAWIEVDGQVVVGGPAPVARYRPHIVWQHARP